MRRKASGLELIGNWFLFLLMIFMVIVAPVPELILFYGTCHGLGTLGVRLLAASSVGLMITAIGFTWNVRVLRRFGVALLLLPIISIAVYRCKLTGHWSDDLRILGAFLFSFALFYLVGLASLETRAEEKQTWFKKS